MVVNLPADIAYGQRLLSDARLFPEFCEICLKIIPRQGGKLVDFKLNKIQRWFFENFMLPDYLVGKPLRLVILKCRQNGFSTMISAWSLWCTLGHKHWNSLLIAKDSDQSKNVFTMTKRFIDNMPQNGILPWFPTKRDRDDMIVFNNPDQLKYKRVLEQIKYKVFLDSRILISSGEKREDLGRSGTFQTVHASEAAFWPALGDSLSALSSTCPDSPQSSFFIETTANGYNEFHDLWTNRVLQNRDVFTYWKNVFVPWYWNSEYELRNTNLTKRFLDDYEEKLYILIIADATIEPANDEKAWAKLFWRRKEIESRMGDVDLFAQEYPATDSEAFVSTGRPVYPKAQIQDLELQVCKPTWKSDIALEETGQPLVTPSDNGDFLQWKEPEKGEMYIVSADVAEGKAVKGLKGRENRYDYTCAHVLKVTPFPPIEQVAVWHGSIDPDRFGDTLVAIARLYNNAYLGWEVDGPGAGLAYHISTRLKYTNVYRRESWDEGILKKRWVIGWKTTNTTKPTMVFISKSFVRERSLIIKDVGTLTEMKAFSILGESKYGALSGHDDRVISLCVGLAMAEPSVGLFNAKKKRLEEKLHTREEGGYLSPDSFWNPIIGDEF